MDMKVSATYRLITVAIGILVAMVIAFTLWIKVPKETSISGFKPSPTSMLPVVSELLNPIIRVHVSPEE